MTVSLEIVTLVYVSKIVTILFNLPETQYNTDNKLSVSNIFRNTDVIIDPINVLRLGKLSNKNRPIRATLPTPHDVFEILKNKR